MVGASCSYLSKKFAKNSTGELPERWSYYPGDTDFRMIDYLSHTGSVFHSTARYFWSHALLGSDRYRYGFYCLLLGLEMDRPASSPPKNFDYSTKTTPCPKMIYSILRTNCSFPSLEYFFTYPTVFSPQSAAGALDAQNSSCPFAAPVKNTKLNLP